MPFLSVLTYYGTICYSSNSHAYNTQTIPEPYVTRNPITQFHNRYMTVNIVSLLASQILVQNSIPLYYRYTTVILPLYYRYVTINIVFGTQKAYAL